MSQNQKSLSLEQFIESNRTQYATQKGIQASNEYSIIIQPYIQEIIKLQQENKQLLEKIPKNKRVKVIPKGKK